jgi:hypothetical protein
MSGQLRQADDKYDRVNDQQTRTATDQRLTASEQNLQRKTTTRGGLALGQGEITLANGDNNNVALDFATHVRIKGPSGAFAITGVQHGERGAFYILRNTTGQVMTIKNESAASAANNRISVPDNADLVISATNGTSVILVYDVTLKRWVVVNWGAFKASNIDNDSSVTGSTVKDALNALLASILAGVSSVFGRTGAVVAALGDYALTQIYNSPITPQGRLTAASGVPVMSSNVTGATSCYYTPYIGQIVPIYDGTRWVATDIGGELSNVLANSSTGKAGPAAVAANSNYDLFIWNDAGTVRLTRGPAWTSATARGTGAGTTELQQVNGIWTNKQAITNGPAANRGIYVGSIRTDGSGTLSVSFGGSTNGGVLGRLYVWNMYNRKQATVLVSDTTSYTYSSSTVRSAHGSANNAITFLFGFAEDAFLVNYKQIITFTAAASNGVAWGANTDSTINFDVNSVFLLPNPTAAVRTYELTMAGLYPATLLGAHTVNATEQGDGTNAIQFNGFGTATFMGLFWC